MRVGVSFGSAAQDLSKNPEPKNLKPKNPEPKDPEPKNPEPKDPEPKDPEPKDPELEDLEYKVWKTHLGILYRTFRSKIRFYKNN